MAESALRRTEKTDTTAAFARPRPAHHLAIELISPELRKSIVRRKAKQDEPEPIQGFDENLKGNYYFRS